MALSHLHVVLAKLSTPPSVMTLCVRNTSFEYTPDSDFVFIIARTRRCGRHYPTSSYWCRQVALALGVLSPGDGVYSTLCYSVCSRGWKVRESGQRIEREKFSCGYLQWTEDATGARRLALFILTEMHSAASHTEAANVQQLRCMRLHGSRGEKGRRGM